MKKINILFLFSLIIISFSVSFVSATVYINEFVVDPQTDWNGNGPITETDEWVELYNDGIADVDLTGWNLTLNDSSPAVEELTATISAQGYLVILNPADSLNMNGQLLLHDNSGIFIDSVSYGNWDDGNIADNAPDGNANDITDECVSRSPNGVDTDIDNNDFVKTRCTYGSDNDVPVPRVITVPTDFPTIQDAIDASIPGDIITVNSGTYTEDLIIPVGKDNLEIAGETGAIIKGVANVDIADWPLAASNIEILSDDVKIHGFTIESPDYEALKYTSGIVIGAKNTEIYDNDLIINSADTIDEISQVIQTYSNLALPGVDISGLNIHDNTFTHKHSAGTWGYEAIYINPDDGVGHIYIRNNDFEGEILRAITSERSKTTIEDNNIITELNIAPDGLVAAGAWQGINVRKFDGSLQSAITITGNIIEGLAPTNGFNQGIRLGQAGQTFSNVVVEENTINDNKNGILVVVEDEVTINYNEIEGNTDFGVKNDDVTELDAENNLWGDCLGPYHPITNPSSQGDQVSDNVDYTPWIGLCITNKTNVTCPFESDDITLEANVSGLDIQDVWFSVGINGVYTNITAISLGGNIYSITIPSSDLTGGANVVWNVYATDPYTTYNNSWKEFDVLANTIVNVDPATPDGDQGWYITIPEFTLVPDPTAINSYYRWDGTPLILYTAPFGLEDIPNPPPESAGTLDLSFFSTCFSQNESEQTELFYIDVTSPQIGEETPENDTTIYLDDPLISATIDEIYGSNSGIDLTTIVMEIDGAGVTPTITSLSGTKEYLVEFQTADLTNGIHEVEITAGDIADNPLTVYTWHFEVGAAEEFSMIVTNPVNGTNFSERRIDLDIITNREVDLKYSDNNGPFRSLCRSCLGYSRSKTFKDGYHDVKISAFLAGVIIATEERNFLVDTKAPRIHDILPEDEEIVIGTVFEIEYTEEESLEKIELYWKEVGQVDYNIEELVGCEQGRRVTCSIDLDLSAYSGEDIEFFFKIYDALESVESDINIITIDNDDPIITLNNPLQDSNQDSKRVQLDIALDEKVDMLKYKDLSDNNPKFRRLCKNCQDYDKSKTFKDGQHNLVIKATDYVGNNDEETVDFFVDSKAPKIRKVLPKKKAIVSGTEFSLEYDEDNLQSVELTIISTTQGTTTVPLEGCEAGRRKTCNIEYSLTQYDGEDIEFYFTVTDVATETQSKTHTITVDSTPPEITLNLPIDGSTFEERRVQFDIGITEEVTLEYKDTADSNPRFKRLCKKCDEYTKSKSFRKEEEHNLEIRATDKAGNTDIEFVSFTIL